MRQHPPPERPHVVARPLMWGGWRGALYLAGTEVWCCNHEHRDARPAERCASAALKEGWGAGERTG